MSEADDNPKILTKGNRIITLKEFYREELVARKEMARMSFEEKIKALIALQEIAFHWGGKKDVIIWKSP
jgi:hypothetical protein